MEIGKNFACEGQRYNHIPGNEYLDNKDTSVLDLLNYSENHRDCFDVWNFTPYTLILEDKKQCETFVESLRLQKDSKDIK